MGRTFDDDERARLAAVLDDLVPGASALGAVDYVQRLLTALDHEPPRIWAAPGGWSTASGPDGWIDLGPWERHAWRRRIADLTDTYERVLAGSATAADRRIVHAHACEASYGDPAYGGNRGSAGWQRIAFPEPLFPPARTTEGGAR